MCVKDESAAHRIIRGRAGRRDGVLRGQTVALLSVLAMKGRVWEDDDFKSVKVCEFHRRVRKLPIANRH